MGKFYVSQRTSAYCSKCKKPATHKVLGPYNDLYGHFCKKHAEQKRKSLEAYYKKKEE